MATVLLALLDTHPDGPEWARAWLTETLRLNLPGFVDDSGGQTLRGWSVGAAWGNETLVQSRPVVRERSVDPLDDILRTPASCVVAALCFQSTTASGLVSAPGVRLSRFRRWLGVRVGGSLDPHQANTLRCALPDFLARHQVDRTDDELVFLTFLARLHNQGALRKTYASAETIREALAHTATAVELPHAHNMMVSDGRTFAMLHEGGALVSFQPRPDQCPPAGLRLSNPADSGQRTNLLLLYENMPNDVPQHGGERIAGGAFSLDMRQPCVMSR